MKKVSLVNKLRMKIFEQTCMNSVSTHEQHSDMLSHTLTWIAFRHLNWDFLLC